ncbi:MAG: hypothetical protein ACYDH5_19505 [Acidimicrobiales bacterium]
MSGVEARQPTRVGRAHSPWGKIEACVRAQLGLVVRGDNRLATMLAGVDLGPEARERIRALHDRLQPPLAEVLATSRLPGSSASPWTCYKTARPVARSPGSAGSAPLPPSRQPSGPPGSLTPGRLTGVRLRSARGRPTLSLVRSNTTEATI